MFKIVGDDIYFKSVFVAKLNKNLIPSFRDEVESALKNDFYTEDEINEIKRTSEPTVT